MVFWELYPVCMIHWINKLYSIPATAWAPRTSRTLVVTPNPRLRIWVTEPTPAAEEEEKTAGVEKTFLIKFKKHKKDFCSRLLKWGMYASFLKFFFRIYSVKKVVYSDIFIRKKHLSWSDRVPKKTFTVTWYGGQKRGHWCYTSVRSFFLKKSELIDVCMTFFPPYIHTCVYVFLFSYLKKK